MTEPGPAPTSDFGQQAAEAAERVGHTVHRPGYVEAPPQVADVEEAEGAVRPKILQLPEE